MSGVEQSTKLDLDRIIFIGRTYEEYKDMFSLSEEEIQRNKILDCPAGACSFTAVANRKGSDVTACDLAYDHAPEDLKSKGLEDIEHAMTHMQTAKSNYRWDYFVGIDGLKKYRLQALYDCSEDMKKGDSRYVPATLPVLPFKNGEFDLVLSAHFLFIYADRLDERFHIETLQELLRVAQKEVRIFPLVDLEGKRAKYLDKVIDFLQNQGHAVEEIKTAYEFQRNAHTMLKIVKG